MKKTLSFVLVGMLAVSFSACGKAGGKSALTDSGKATFEATVSVQEIKTSAKTPQGNPLRAYEVTVAKTGGQATEKPAGDKADPNQGGSLIVVVGDVSVPVEFQNAKYATVGGTKIQLNLYGKGGIAFVVPVKNPANNMRQLENSVPELKTMLSTDKFNVPLADLVMSI